MSGEAKRGLDFGELVKEMVEPYCLVSSLVVINPLFRRHNIDRTRNIGEHGAVFTLKECDFLGTLLENVGQAHTERIPSRVFLIDS